MEFDKEKTERQSKGDGTRENPFTYNEKFINPTKEKVIQEGAALGIERVMKGGKVYFTFETGTFVVMHALTPKPLFVAVPETHKGKQELTSPTYATSAFTLEAIKRLLEG